MRQEINLHRPARRQRDWLGASMMPLWASVAVVLLGGGGVAYWAHVDRLETAAEELAVRVAAEEQRLAELVAESTQPGQRLRARVEEAQDELRSRRQMVAGIAEPDSLWQGGFSPLFAALARESVDDLWLSRIRARASGDLRFEGFVTEADAVPAFVEGLQREPEFIGQSFRGVSIERRTGSVDQLGFVLRGRADDDG